MKNAKKNLEPSTHVSVEQTLPTHYAANHNPYAYVNVVNIKQSIVEKIYWRAPAEPVLSYSLWLHQCSTTAISIHWRCTVMQRKKCMFYIGWWFEVKLKFCVYLSGMLKTKRRKVFFFVHTLVERYKRNPWPTLKKFLGLLMSTHMYYYTPDSVFDYVD